LTEAAPAGPGSAAPGNELLGIAVVEGIPPGSALPGGARPEVMPPGIVVPRNAKVGAVLPGSTPPGIAAPEVALPGAAARAPDAASEPAGAAAPMLSGVSRPGSKVLSTDGTAPGNALKNELAIRARVATSGRPVAASGVGVSSLVGMGIIVPLTNLDVIEHSHRIVREDGLRAVQGNQVRSDRLSIDPHEADR
jgi:hypothetical protein